MLQKNINKCAISAFILSSLALTACNGGSSSSTTTSSGGYAGAATQAYIESLPSGGKLTSITNMIYPAESNGTVSLFFQVESITGNISVGFTAQQESSGGGGGSDPVPSAAEIKAPVSGVPTLSPSTCNFTTSNESCTLTLSLNDASAGTYTITPNESSIDLTPLSFTTMNPTSGSSYTFTNGSYSLTGNQWDGSNDCQLAPLPTNAVVTVNTNAGTVCVVSDSTPQFCQPIESSALVNTPVQLPYITTFCASSVGATCVSTGTDTAVNLTNNGGLYDTNTFGPVCPSLVAYHIITKISN